MTTYFKQLENVIRTMHYNYSIGDILEIRQFADGIIEVESKGYGMPPVVRRGTVTGTTFGKRTVRLYGHQKTVVII